MSSLYFIFSSTSAPQIKISMVFFLSRGQNMHLFTCQGKNYGMTLELEMHTREVKRISWRLQRVFLLSKGLELLFPGKTGFVEAQHRWWTILILWYVANGLMLVGTCQSQPSTLWILALIYFVLEFLLTCLYMVTSGPGGCSSGCLVMVSRWLCMLRQLLFLLSPFFFFFFFF